MKHVLSVLTVAAALALVGCATGARGRFQNPSVFTDTDAGTLEAVARRVVRELRFEPIVPEKSKGHIETRPLTGASWFEFWRKDTIGPTQVAEASLHTVRRRATVSISPKDGGGARVFVKVIKERKSAPGSMPESVGESFNIFDTEDTHLMRQDTLAETDHDWITLGRDPRLEQYILERIHAALK